MQLRAFERESERAVPSSSAHSDPHCREVDGGAGTLALLGTGGSSEVWHAVDRRGRSIALKTLLPELARRCGAVDMLQREHELLRELAHPHLVETYGIVEFRGAPALAMEYLGGGDLVPLLGAAPIHWLEAVRGVLAALKHLHSRGYVHRDLKARNVLFDERNRVRLVDFAQAAPCGSMPAPGGTTAAYRSTADKIEAVHDGEDVYAFAVLLHELLFGRLPNAVPAAAPPLGVPDSALPGGLATLQALVGRTLSGRAADAAGSLSAFDDVLESVAAGR